MTSRVVPSLLKIFKHGFGPFVETLHLSNRMPGLQDQILNQFIELGRMFRTDLKSIAEQIATLDLRQPNQIGGESTRIVGRDFNQQGTIIQQLANFRQRAGRDQPAPAENKDSIRQFLDVTQDMARDKNTFASASKANKKLVDFLSTAGINSGQGFVEQQDLGIVDQRLRQFESLPHSMAATGDSPMCPVGHSDVFQCCGCALADLTMREPVQGTHRVNEVFAGQLFIKMDIVRTKSDQSFGGCGSCTQWANRHLSLRRSQLPAGEFQQSRFAGPI